MKRYLALAITIMAAALAMSLPGSAAANVVGGGGSNFTIDTNRFTAYSCNFHSSYVWGPNYRTGYRYNCSGGVYVKYNGERVWGTKCVSNDQLWSWSRQAC